MKIKAFNTEIDLGNKCHFCNKGELTTSNIAGLTIPVRCNLCKTSFKDSLKSTDIYSRGDIEYSDGSSKKHISSSLLENIRSRVVTHEGQMLSGSEGRKYMDKYSKQYLKKDLAGSYKSQKIK
jgi:hypothetical protein